MFADVCLFVVVNLFVRKIKQGEPNSFGVLSCLSLVVVVVHPCRVVPMADDALASVITTGRVNGASLVVAPT